MLLFEYRIIRTPYGQFMPQRGIHLNLEGLSNRLEWRDAVPCAGPTRELADLYITSLQKTDGTETSGEVVWRSE